ncbi:MAG: class I SAM-dependent methyltransferase [Candidatus Omnitrophota bacterium]
MKSPGVFRGLLLMALIVTVNRGSSFSAVPQATKPAYVFTDTFKREHLEYWDTVLASYKGKQGVRYLEIGVFEGRSLIWMLENILTHDTARATGIDIFPKDLKERCAENLRVSGYERKVELITGFSHLEARKLPVDSFDIIYIDGSHTADDVLADAVSCWPLLKKNGTMIFDNYEPYYQFWPEELRPEMAIDTFLSAYRNYLDIVSTVGRQVVIRKKDVRYSDKRCSVIGPYVYNWYSRQLRKIKNSELVPLSYIEQHLLIKIIHSQKLIYSEYKPDPELLKDPGVRALADKLNLKFDGL